MEKKIRFSLIMDDEIEVRTIEELRNNFSLTKILDYLYNGKLIIWLRDRYQTTIADHIEKLDTNNNDLPRQICEIFEIHNVAFNQDDLYDLLDTQYDTIYLYGDKFEISLDKENITYIGFNNPTVVITNTKEKMEEKNIKCLKVQIDNKNITKKIKEDNNMSFSFFTSKVDPDSSTTEDKNTRAKNFLNSFRDEEFLDLEDVLVTVAGKEFWDAFKKDDDDFDIAKGFIPELKKMYNEILSYLTTHITEDGINENFMIIRDLVASWLSNDTTSKKHEVLMDIWMDSYVDDVIIRKICREFISENYDMGPAIYDGRTIFIYKLLGYIVDSKLGNSNDTTDITGNDDIGKTTGSGKKLDPEAQVFKYVSLIAEYTSRCMIEIFTEEDIREYKNNQELINRNHEEMDKVDFPHLWKATIERGGGSRSMVDILLGK